MQIGGELCEVLRFHGKRHHRPRHPGHVRRHTACIWPPWPSRQACFPVRRRQVFLAIRFCSRTFPSLAAHGRCTVLCRTLCDGGRCVPLPPIRKCGLCLCAPPLHSPPEHPRPSGQALRRRRICGAAATPRPAFRRRAFHSSRGRTAAVHRAAGTYPAFHRCPPTAATSATPTHRDNELCQ